jgi:predicted RNase H-like HicB family nuclease
MSKRSKREFSVIVERDEEGYFVATVPELPGCHMQARSVDQLLGRVRKSIRFNLEVQQRIQSTTEFVEVQRVIV